MVEEIIGEIPDGWRYATLGQVCVEGGGGIQTGPFGSQLHASDYVSSGVPTVMPTNIGDNRIVVDGIARILESDASRLGRHRLQLGDIVYSRRGDVERRALVRAPEVGWLCGTGSLRVRVSHGADYEFISQWLGHPQVRAWITQHAVGATMANLNTAILSSVPVVLPPAGEQRAIAGVLGALDDKIESNRRLSGLLEQHARTVFDALFDTTAQPTGVPLAELVEINPKRVLSGGTPGTYVEMADLPTSSALVERWQHRPAGSGQRFKNGDVLVARITPCLENGKTAFVDMLGHGEVGWGSTEYIVFRSRDPLPPEWAYCLARSAPFVEFAVRNMSGTSGRQRCPASAFDSYYVAAPHPSSVVEFGASTEGSFARMGKARDESRALAALRDALLPELLSGRLRVREAEKVIEDVV